MSSLGGMDAKVNASAEYYVKAMERMIEKGETWLGKEQSRCVCLGIVKACPWLIACRIAGLLASPSLSAVKLDELRVKANILSSFTVGKLGEAVDAAQNMAADAVESAQGMAGDAANAASGAAGDAVGAAKGAAAAAQAVTGDAVDAAKGAAGDAMDAANDATGQAAEGVDAFVKMMEDKTGVKMPRKDEL